MTGFCDDEAIPTWAKAYAAAGVTDGIIRGTSTAEGVAFRGEEPITFNEAATVLNRVLDLGDVDLAVWYADREAVPLLGGSGGWQYGGRQCAFRRQLWQRKHGKDAYPG